MALSALFVWEVRTTGSDSNGGGFKTGAAGTDYSQQDAAQYNDVDLAIDGALNTKVTSAAHSFVTADVGNIINITAGTGFTVGRYEIVSVASGAATLDRACGTVGSTGGTYFVGGAILSPAVCAGAVVAGNTVYIKSGTYIITTTSENVAGGVASFTGGSLSFTWIIGYENTRAEASITNKPVIQAAASGFTSAALMKCGTFNFVKRLKFDGQSKSTVKGLLATAVGSNLHGIELEFTGCTNGGFDGNTRGLVIQCIAYYNSGGSTIHALNASHLIGCEAYDNTCSGFYVRESAIQCLSYRNRGSNVRGFTASSSNTGRIQVINCIAFYNEGNGFTSENHYVGFVNCISYNNGAYGFTGVTYYPYCINCAAGANTSGDFHTSISWNQSSITLSVDPFTNVSTSTDGAANFSLNTTAGGGASCRASGFITSTFDDVISNYLDVGVLQHSDPAGGGSILVHPGMTGGING